MLFGATEILASANTSVLLMAVLRALFGSVDPATFFAVHLALRKLAHVTVYAVLAALWFRALRGGLSGWQTRWAFGALAVCLGVALLDETLQSLMPSRGASLLDVGLDMLGASAAVASISFRLRRHRPSLSC